MNKEIKEMCHKCKKYPAEYNQTYCEFCLGISNKDDYITNLQTKLDIEKKINDNNSEAYLKLLHSEEMYKQRIDKAVEYIEWNLDKNQEVIEYINFDGNFNKVLNILKGSDKE